LDADMRIAKLFSNALTPFSVAAIASIVFSWFSPIGIGTVMGPLSSALVGILTLCVGPLLPVFLSAKIGRTDLDVSDVKRRRPLYVLGLASYVAGAVIFSILDNRIMFAMSVAYVCVASVTFLITLVWKISAHTAGIAGPITAFVFVFGTWAMPFYMLSILMIWSRVKLAAHTLPQAVAGVIVAIFVTSLVYSTVYL
jgi:hypothetical protein